jgi:hypothetical protein
VLSLMLEESVPIRLYLFKVKWRMFGLNHRKSWIRSDINCVEPILVISQPLKEEPAPGFKCKDKFLIQSVGLTPESENMGLTDLVSAIEFA